MDDDFIEETDLDGVLIINRPIIKDERGFFRETFRKKDIENKLNINFEIVQSNHARSSKGVLRGIHVAPWHKLVTVTRGLTQQVVIDIRKDSPTFGKHLSIKVGEDKFSTLFIPAGFGNSYLVLSDEADYVYYTSDYWKPNEEWGIKYDDPTLNIAWEIKDVIVSKKDQMNPFLQEALSKK